jgi:hypothetical protein
MLFTAGIDSDGVDAFRVYPQVSQLSVAPAQLAAGLLSDWRCAKQTGYSSHCILLLGLQARTLCASPFPFRFLVLALCAKISARFAFWTKLRSLERTSLPAHRRKFHAISLRPRSFARNGG